MEHERVSSWIKQIELDILISFMLFHFAKAGAQYCFCFYFSYKNEHWLIIDRVFCLWHIFKLWNQCVAENPQKWNKRNTSWGLPFISTMDHPIIEGWLSPDPQKIVDRSGEWQFYFFMWRKPELFEGGLYRRDTKITLYWK